MDDDCDARIDESGPLQCYADADRDGYAAAGTAATPSCPAGGPGGCPAGFTDRMPVAGDIDCGEGVAVAVDLLDRHLADDGAQVALDRLERDPEGRLVVVDLKTSARRYTNLQVEA